MNLVLGPIRDLVDRKLWPVALLLLAAALAAPLLLADGEEVAPPAAAAAPVTDEGLSAAALVQISGPDGVARRRVLGSRKDPFTPSGRQPRPAPLASAAPSGPPAGASAASSAGPGGDFSAPGSFSVAGGGSSTGGSASPSAPSPLSPSPLSPSPSPLAGPPSAGPIAPAPSSPAPGTPKPRGPEVFSLRINFDEALRTINRLDPLPDAEKPSIIYLGVLEDGRTAVFLLDADVEAQGDGTCHPSPRDCQRLHLREGETEFFDIGGESGGQHQIDLIDIRAKRARSGAAASASASSAGRNALRSRLGRVGRLRFDARTGRLRRLSLEAWRRQVRAADRAAR